MSLAPTDPVFTAEVVMSRDDAMEITRKISLAFDNLGALVLQAWRGQAWKALDCASWDDYAERFLNGLRLPAAARKEIHGELAAEGMSTRAIAKVTGASQGTVVNDLSTEQNYSVDKPREVQGRDGKTRTYGPKPQPVVIADDDEVFDAEVISDPEPSEFSPESKPRYGRRTHREEFNSIVDVESGRWETIAGEYPARAIPLIAADPNQLVFWTAQLKKAHRALGEYIRNIEREAR